MAKHIDEAALADELDVVEMGDLVGRLNASGKWWMIGKGKVTPKEPLYACLIQEACIDGRTIARIEGDDLSDCIERALARIKR